MQNESDYVDESLTRVPDEELATTQTPLPQLYNPEQQVFAMEQAVKYADRLIRARNTLIRMFTYSEDWTSFGDGDRAKACLSAAGAMRIADKGNFPIRFFNVQSRKENIKDKDGSIGGYRYVFEGYAQLRDRVVHALGQYSTRDALLGKSGGEYRDPQEINESYIRQAAHTYFKGNAIKDLMGLKGIPWAEYEKLTASAGQDATRTTSVRHQSGTKGGISDDDRSRQAQLVKLLLDLANRNLTIVAEEQDGKVVQRIESVGEKLADYSSQQKDPYLTVAQSSLRSMTTFKGKDGIVTGVTDFARVKGRQLEMTLKIATEMIAKLPPDESWVDNS